MSSSISALKVFFSLLLLFRFSSPKPCLFSLWLIESFRKWIAAREKNTFLPHNFPQNKAQSARSAVSPSSKSARQTRLAVWVRGTRSEWNEERVISSKANSYTRKSFFYFRIRCRLALRTLEGEFQAFFIRWSKREAAPKRLFSVQSELKALAQSRTRSLIINSPNSQTRKAANTKKGDEEKKEREKWFIIIFRLLSDHERRKKKCFWSA